MKKNQEKQDEAAEKLVNDFIRRCNVADSKTGHRWRLELYVQAPLIILMEGWNFLRKMQLYTFIASCAN